MVSLERGARRLASTVVVPLLAGAGLAAFCLLALSSTVSSVSPGRTTSGSLLDDAPAASAAHAGDKRSYEHFVASAAAHEVGAEQQLAHAQRLRAEAATARSRAAALQSSLAQLLDEEANRDKAAERLAAKAHAINRKAMHDVVSKRSLSSAWNDALTAAQAKRDAFLAHEKAAGKDKAAAKALLNKERKLFEKSYQMVDKEAKAQARVARRDEQLATEKREVRRIQDHEHVVAELPHQQQQALREAQQQAQQQQAAASAAKSLPGFPSARQAESAEQQADRKAEARKKRPLWGDRKWPSYYDNALTDPGSKKLFEADEPTHPAPRLMEMGDDNQAFDHPKPGADTAVPMPKQANPARMQAMYQIGNTGSVAYSTNSQMGLPPPPQHMLHDKHPEVPPAILKHFEADVQKMEQPVRALEGRLEQTLSRMQAEQTHKQALHLYNTDTESWKELSRKAEREREERVAAAAAESRDLVHNMNSAMEDANNKMRAEMRDTTSAMQAELEDAVHKLDAKGRGKVSKANSEAIAQTQAREAEMEKVMGEYVAHERDENHKLQSQMRDLVAAAEHQKADVISEAERWKMGEEAKYKHEMEAQLRKAEMKVDQARSEASMALHAAQQDANAGSRARLRAAQEHEEHALQALSKAELEERQQASVFRRKADGEHREVSALKGELERIEDKHEVRQEVLAARRRERERMEQRFETEQREEARKDAMLKEKLQDAKAVAEREQQAALEREKELAIARVKQRALQAIAKQRQHMQAEEDLAHERKVEVLKEKRLAAKEAAELRLEQRMHTSARGPTDAEHMGRRQVARRGRVARAAGGVTIVPKFKAAAKSEVKNALVRYEQRIAAKEKLEVKLAAAKAAQAARKQEGARVSKMAEQLHAVERKLWRKERRRKLAVENVFGSLGSLGGSHDRTHEQSVLPSRAVAGQEPRRMAAEHQRGSSAATVPRAAAKSLPAAGAVDGAHGRPVQHARQTSAQELAMAKALGFGSVQALRAHQRAVRGGVNLWGSIEGSASTKVAPGALPNPTAVEKLREQEAAAAKPHTPQHKTFYNSGLSSDVDVPVALAASEGNSFL